MNFSLVKDILVISVGRGEAFSWSSIVRDTITKDPIDLSGKTFVGKIKTPADVEVATITAVGGVDGGLSITAGSTDSWPLGDLYIDLLMNPDARWIIKPGSIVRVKYSATVGL